MEAEIALIEYIVKSLVDEPEQVEIASIVGDHSTVLELRVAPDDMGKIIGKQGRIAKAMRSLLVAMGARSGHKVVLQIID